MNVVIAPAALIDIVEARRWWEENRRDAPHLLATQLAATLGDLGVRRRPPAPTHHVTRPSQFR